MNCATTNAICWILITKYKPHIFEEQEQNPHPDEPFQEEAMKNSPFSVILPVLLSLALGGCGKKTGEAIVAQVGDRNITVEDLWSFQAGLPEHFRSDTSGAAAQREYLDALIGRQILLLEAEARGLGSDPELTEQLRREEVKRVLREFREREIRDKVVVTEEEMRRRFAEGDLDREVRIRNILVRTREEADAIMAELARGASFEDLARERSIDSQTKHLGGDGGFCGKGEIITPGGEDIAYSLKIGEVSQPFEEYRGFQIVKVTDERPVRFERVAGSIGSALAREKFYLRREELIEELGEELKLSLVPEGVDLLLERSPSDRSLPALSEEEKQHPLYTYEGGSITLGDHLRALRAILQRPVLNDRNQVLAFAKESLVPNVLFWEAARRTGFPEEPAVREWVRRKREDLMIETLRKRDVMDRVRVTDAETRRLYETYPDYFSMPEIVEIVEVLSPTQEEAEEILERAREGEKLEELSAQYTIREKGGSKKTKFPLRQLDLPFYGTLVDSALSAPMGQIRGPVPSKGGYSVFKVINRIGQHIEPYEKVKRRAAAVLRVQKRQALFAQMMARLHEEYAPKVTVFDENLKWAAERMRESR